MGYDDVDDSFARSKAPKSENHVANTPQTAFSPPQNPEPSGKVFQPAPLGRRYCGLILASPLRRYLSALFTYGPSILSWFIAPALAGLGSPAHPVANALLDIVAFMVILGGWGWFVFTMQHEGWQTPGGAIMKTRVVWIRRDEDGAMRAYYPVRSQLIVRMVLALFVDSWLGWVSILFSRTNRSIGDLVAGTVVIVEGRIVPNLPYAQPRGKKD